MPAIPPTDRSFRDDDAPVDQTDELLVAYLDGELDEQARGELEDRLSSDDSLRERLAELQIGWEMLDHLPQASVTEDFARTTLEMAAASQSQMLEIQRRGRPWRGMLWIAALVVVTGLATTAGYLVAERLDQQRFRSQLDDLPLAEKLDAYLLDVELELMVQLASNPQWNSAMRLGVDAGGIATPVGLDLESRGYDQRAAAIDQLDPRAQTALASNWERLRSLSDDQLRRVRQRYEAVRQLEQSDRVLRTMQQYAAWWNQLSPQSKDRIDSARPEEKLEVILETVDRTSRGWLMNYGISLSEADREMIYTTLEWIARDRIQRARAYVEANAVDEEDRWERSWFADLSARRLLQFMAGGAHWSFMQRLRSGESVDALEDSGRQETPPPEFSDEEARQRWLREVLYGLPTDEELADIEKVLGFINPRALFVLNAEADSRAERRAALWRWCVAVIVQASPRGNSTEAIYEDYQALGHEFRDLLDLRPPDQILRELRDEWRRR